MKLREERKLLISRIKAMIDTQASLLEFDVENIETKKTRRKETVKETVKREEQPEINVDDILEKLL